LTALRPSKCLAEVSTAAASPLPRLAAISWEAVWARTEAGSAALGASTALGKDGIAGRAMSGAAAEGRMEPAEGRLTGAAVMLPLIREVLTTWLPMLGVEGCSLREVLTRAAAAGWDARRTAKMERRTGAKSLEGEGMAILSAKTRDFGWAARSWQSQVMGPSLMGPSGPRDQGFRA
jgi:hypothetical protein